MGKIAASLNDICQERERRGAAPGLSVETLAATDDWAVEDVICTYRPSDRSFEERHSRYRVALVGAGTFQCRSGDAQMLLTPGSLLLGNPHDSFECGHEHGTGDRCLAFGYSAAMFEQLAFEAGVRGRPRLRGLRVPPIGALAPLIAEASAVWAAAPGEAAFGAWEELGVRLAAAAARFAAAPVRVPRSPANAERGVARAVALIERDPSSPLPLQLLAHEAGLSPFHFVRAFARVTGLTPHRYLKRVRLRQAAVRLATHDSRVIDIALESGFRDVSNFNHAFREEFGTAPLAHRKRLQRRD